MVAVLVVVISALVHPVAVAGSIPVRVEWDAPAGCANPNDFLAAVQARSDRVRRADSLEDAVRVEVHLSRVGGKIRGELRLADDVGRTELRKVDGASCDEVADALSLTAALALGAPGQWSLRHATRVIPSAAAAPSSIAPSPPSPSSSPPPSPSVSSSPPSTSSSPPSTSSGVLPPSPSSPSSPSLPSSVSLPPATAPLAGMAAGARAAPATTAPTSGEERRPPRPSIHEELSPPREGHPDAAVRTSATTGPGPFDFSLGLGPIATQVVSPSTDLGGALVARMARRSADGVARSLEVAVLHARNDLFSATPAVAVTWTAAALTICPGWGGTWRVTTPIVLEICGIGLGGWLTASERAVTVPRSATRSWWSAGAVLRARVALGWRMSLQIDAVAHVPLIHRRFVTSTPDETVAESPSVAGMLGLTVLREL